MQISGLSAVVTGGASGLGAAAAEHLAAAGARVAILDMNAELGAQHAARLGGAFFPCDVTKEETAVAALQAARAAHGVERILVNCAGIAAGERTVRRDRATGEIVPHQMATFEAVVAVNLTGTFRMMRLSAAAMMTLAPITADGGRGVIVNTSSVAAEDGQLGQIAYAASKGGVAAMTLPAARDLAKDGIRVAAILPGLFDTPMFAGLPDDIRQALASNVPFPQRLGHPSEFGALVQHICENDMLNGVCIRLDGAVRLPARS